MNMSIRQAAKYMDRSPTTVRTLLRKKRLAGYKNMLGQWQTTHEACDKYMATKGKRRGKKSYILKLTEQEFVEFKKQHPDADIKKRYQK